MQQINSTLFSLQAPPTGPGHGTGAQGRELNDEMANETMQKDASTQLPMVISVLANVIGGTLLLSGMFLLPHIIAGLMD